MVLTHTLTAETSVEQDSKQVQVDLQDLGYETCGRSENEAEREDASSPGNLAVPFPVYCLFSHPYLTCCLSPVTPL